MSLGALYLVIGCILLGLLAFALIVVAIVLLIRKSQRKEAQTIPAAQTAPFAGRIQELRCSHGFSQEYVAEQLGVSRQAVSKWETGSSEPSTANLRALAELYGVTVDTLINAK